MIYYESEYLAHHGIKGMRWGVRRYQNPDGSLTPAGERRYEKEVAKYNKARGRVLQLKPKTKVETPEEFEARKKRILASGNAEEVLSLRGKVSNEELKTAKTRLDLEREIAAMRPQKKSGWDKMNMFMGKMSDVAGWIEKGSKSVDAIKDLVYKYTEEGKKKEAEKNAFRKSYIDLGRKYMSELAKMTIDQRESAAKDLQNADKIWRATMGQNISKKDK